MGTRLRTPLGVGAVLMNPIEATKFYIRYREDLPETTLGDCARRGFWEHGVETVPFSGFGDIPTLKDLGPTVGVAGYIGDVHEALTCMGVPVPSAIDYPESLRVYFGRLLWRATLGDVRNPPDDWPGDQDVFVKPVALKTFKGFVWNGDAASRRHVVLVEDSEPVWCSTVVTWASEYRVFVLDGHVLDCRRYKGDWSRAPSRMAVDDMIRRYVGAPRAYCLDVGCRRPYHREDDTVTELVEVNDAYSAGHYGLEPALYARWLSARWHEMATAHT